MELSKDQEILVYLLKGSGLGKTEIIAIMLLLKDDQDAMDDLMIWLYDTKPTADEVMNNWVRGYLDAHPRKYILPTEKDE